MTARILASVFGPLGALAAIAVPFLPVHEHTATLQWPQQNSIADVSAPLVAYAPEQLTLTVPCAAVTNLAGAGGGVVVSTVPADVPGAGAKGLVARVSDGNFGVLLGNQTVLSSKVSELAGPGCALRLTSTATAATAQLAARSVTLD